ncbi:MAG TPA: DivIVA domain-containing protein [Longimicrobiales bacterium]|nr:DivIVA domain-containing protein [Longimicrobiales bacterium]
MIDLTPLDVRNKRGDFRKLLRGYDPQEVDTFLELVAERLEEVVRDNAHLRERATALQGMVDSQSGREHAVQEALVTAQELRNEIKGQAQREADLIIAEARSEARSLLAEADAQIRSRLRDTERRLEVGRDTMEEIERRRTRFLKNFRQLLERELEDVEVEEGKEPVDQRPIELDLGRPKGVAREDPSPVEAPATEDPTPAAEPGDGDTAPGVEEALGDRGPDAEGGEEPPALDASVDDLADGYRAEVERLFGEKKASEGEADLFSLPGDDPEEEDTRWG